MTSYSSLFSLAVVVLVAASAQSSAVLPLAAPYAVAPFASSYNAHTVTHNVATPVAAAPYVAAPVAAAPYVAAPAVSAPYLASPYAAAAPYVASPYAAAAPYVASPYVAQAAYPYPYLLK